MNLYSAILVIYVMTVALFGAEGRGGASTTRGLKTASVLFRARRHATSMNHDLPNYSNLSNDEHPPPPPQFRARRHVLGNEPKQPSLVANDPPPPPPQAHFRQRRQMPPGLPDGVPMPPMA